MRVALQSSPHNRTDLLRNAGFDVIEKDCFSENDFIELFDGVDGAQVNTVPQVSEKVIRSASKLKVISRMGVGVDSIDLDAATRNGVAVCNVPGVNTIEVAEHAVAMLLSLTRTLNDSFRACKKGGWAQERLSLVARTRRISAQTVGIIGFGNIGRAFAHRIGGFCPSNIIACDPNVRQSTADLYGVELVSLEQVLQRSNYVSVHCSANSSTHKLINKKTLSLMREDAFLVNTSRGDVVDGEALAEALRTGGIGGAALDVTQVEPPDRSDSLLSLSNCYISPHIAGYSPQFLRDCPIMQAENIIRVLSGKGNPHGIANPEVLKTIAVMQRDSNSKWSGIRNIPATGLKVSF